MPLHHAQRRLTLFTTITDNTEIQNCPQTNNDNQDTAMKASFTNEQSQTNIC